MTFGAQTFQVGELDQRVSIEMLSSVPDGMGGYTTEWVKLCNAWAKVRPKSTKEEDNADRVEGSAVYIFIMRYREIDDRCRFIWRGKPFNVRPSMDRGPRCLYISVEAERGVAQ